MKQPYINYTLNNLEALSLLSSAFTVYCGIFFIVDGGTFPNQFFCTKFDFANNLKFSQSEPFFRAFTFRSNNRLSSGLSNFMASLIP
jgi:hypothetical protein